MPCCGPFRRCDSLSCSFLPCESLKAALSVRALPGPALVFGLVALDLGGALCLSGYTSILSLLCSNLSSGGLQQCREGRRTAAFKPYLCSCNIAFRNSLGMRRKQCFILRLQNSALINIHY